MTRDDTCGHPGETRRRRATRAVAPLAARVTAWATAWAAAASWTVPAARAQDSETDRPSPAQAAQAGACAAICADFGALQTNPALLGNDAPHEGSTGSGTALSEFASESAVDGGGAANDALFRLRAQQGVASLGFLSPRLGLRGQRGRGLRLGVSYAASRLDARQRFTLDLTRDPKVDATRWTLFVEAKNTVHEVLVGAGLPFHDAVAGGLSVGLLALRTLSSSASRYVTRPVRPKAGDYAFEGLTSERSSDQSDDLVVSPGLHARLPGNVALGLSYRLLVPLRSRRVSDSETTSITRAATEAASTPPGSAFVTDEEERDEDKTKPRVRERPRYVRAGAAWETPAGAAGVEVVHRAAYGDATGTDYHAAVEAMAYGRARLTEAVTAGLAFAHGFPSLTIDEDGASDWMRVWSFHPSVTLRWNDNVYTIGGHWRTGRGKETRSAPEGDTEAYSWQRVKTYGVFVGVVSEAR